MYNFVYTFLHTGVTFSLFYIYILFLGVLSGRPGFLLGVTV